MRFTSRGSDKRYAACSLALVFFFGFLFSSFPFAFAGEGGRSLVLFKFYDEEVEDPEIVYRSLEEILRRLGNLRLEKPGKFREISTGVRYLPEPAPSDVYSWRESLEKAREMFRVLDLSGAARLLERIVEVPYKYELTKTSLDIVREATLLLAFIKFKLGEEDQAGRLVNRLRAFGLDIDEIVEMFPPDFSSFARLVLLKKGGVDLVISSTPSGATVFVNGEEVGKTPLIDTRDEFGKLKVEVRKNGYVTRSFWKFALPGDKVAFEVNLIPDESVFLRRSISRGDFEEAARSAEGFIRRNGLDAALVSVLMKEGKYLKMDLLLVISGENEKNYSLFRNLRLSDKVVNIKTIEPLFEDSLFVGICPNAKLFLEEGDREVEKLTSKWWFWTLLAFGAAGLVYGVSKGGSRSSGGSVTVEF